MTATTASPIPSSTLALVSFTGSGSHPSIGTFNWTGDVARTVTPTFIASNSGVSMWPATCDIYMHINLQLGAFPGKTYRSRTEVHERSTTLTSFDPHINEHYTLVSPVDFEDAALPGTTVFTLSSLNVILN